MKPLTKKVSIAILLFCTNNAFATGIPVVDGAHISATTAGWAQQASDMVTNLARLAAQLKQMKEQYDSMTGSRGMSDLLNSPTYQQARRMLPPDAQQALDLANGGSYGNFGNAINGIKQATTTLSADSFSSPTAAKQWEADLNRAATNKALSAEAYTDAEQRLKNLEDLTEQISQTEDQKAIAELQARIAAEQGFIQNEHAKIQALAMLATAEQQIAQAQARETSIKTGSVENIPRIRITP